MHIVRFVPLFAALFAGMLAYGQAVPDPADEYFRAYLMNNEAERLVQGGDLQRALDKFQQAQTIFDSIAKNSPSWQSDMLSFRRQKITIAITDVQSKMTKAASSPPASTAVANPAPSFAATTLMPAQAATPSLNPAPVSVPVAPAPSTGDPLQDAFEQMKRAIGSREAAIQQQLTETLASLGRYQLGYEGMLKQRDEAVRQRDDFYRQAATLQQDVATQQAKVAGLEKQLASGASVKAELNKARMALADAQGQAEESKQRLAKAEKAVMDQSARLTEATMKLELAEKQRDESNAKVLGLQAENDTLKKRPAVPENMKNLVAENERLKKDLEDTRKQIEVLKSDATNKDTEIAQLKGQLSKIQGELVTLRKENAAYETQVAELTLQLKKIREVTDDPKKSKDSSPQLMAENQLLRGIILRQLRQQARQQQQKALVIEEIKKTENASKDLIDQVEQLGSARVTLSDDEQRLFTTPQLQEIMGSDGIKATLVAKSDAKAGDPAKKTDDKKSAEAKAKAVVEELLAKGNQLLQDSKLAEAATVYEDVLRADPKNATGFAGLAWARLQQDKLDDAEATLKKSLAYDSNNAVAHYMLAVTYFRRDRFNEAMTSFEKSLELNGKNARARHYLGVITSKMGLAERAEREFKSALAIDPGYGEADFNLAVLFATKDPPNWPEAKKHYADAVKKGVKADPAMEKLLSGAKS